MSKIQYTYSYQLKLDGRGFDGGSDVILRNDKSVTASYSNINMEFSLYGVTFRRKVYEPGNIRAEILIKTDAFSTPSVDLLTTMLIRRPVSLQIEKSHFESGKKKVDGTPSVVAKNYYIHEISPQFEKRQIRIEVIDKKTGNPKGETVSYNWIYIKLDIYSPDKLMTLSKYSQAHFGQSLFGDILKNNIDSFQLRFTSTAAETMTNSQFIELNTLKLHHLGYMDGTTQKELIQPYLVQYNESFYDFLRRTANRCGEIFYYEGGKLCVGVSKATSNTSIDNAGRIIFQRISEEALSIEGYTRDSLKEWNSDKSIYEPKGDDVLSDPIKKNDEGYPKDAFPEYKSKVYSYRYNSEIASNDQYMVLFKDKFVHDSVHDLWCGDDAEHTMRTVALLLNSTSLMELFTDFGLKSIESAAKVASKAKEKTQKFNKVLKDWALSSGDKSAVIPTTSTDTKKWITLDYVTDIRNNEQAQMRGMVCVDMGSGFKNVSLGEKITLPSPNNGKTYVVVQIEMSSGKDWQRSYEGFEGDGRPHGGEPSQRFYAIPMLKKSSGEVFYPPLLPGDPFRRSGAQPAFVIDSKDPYGQGRVRIRYPWQPEYKNTYKDINVADYKTKLSTAQTTLTTARKTMEIYGDNIVLSEDGSDPSVDKKSSASDTDFKKAKTALTSALKDYLSARKDFAEVQLKHIITEAGSPWIRMATPMATSGGGMFFRPEVGDEVMVDFENGNVERPYVTGTLYSKNVPAPKEGGRVIVSKNGHTIKMSDPSNSSELLSNLLPPLKMLTMYGVEFEGMDDVASRAMGGIELTDQLGFYNIKMSSHDRLISISSPFGNVNIDALTGISIEAPNGDISITGKNIDLTAYNKITLTSGKNIKLAKDKSRGGYATTGDDWGDVGKHIGKSVSKLFGLSKWIDLSLWRTLIEVFIRPIDGTLEFKSFRYLMLEAGGATTAAEPSLYDNHPTDAYKLNRDVKVLEIMMQYIKHTVDGYVADYINMFNRVQGDYDRVKNYFTAPASIQTPTSGTEMLKTLFHGIDPAWDLKGITDYKDRFTADNSTSLVFPATVDDADKPGIRDDIKTLIDSVFTLVKQVDGFEKMFDNMKSGLKAARKSVNAVKFGSWEEAKSFSRLPGLDFANEAKDVLKLSNPVLDAATEAAVTATVAAENPVAVALRVNLLAPTPKAVHASVAAAADGLYSAGIQQLKKFIDQSAANDALFNAQINPGDFDTWKKYVCRRLACLVIEKCRSANNPFQSFSIAPAEYKALSVPDPNGTPATFYKRSAPINMDFPFTNEDWTRYVNDIKITAGGPGGDLTGDQRFLSGMFDSLVDAAGKIIPFECNVWKREATGEILLSDRKGKTYRFKENGQTESYDNMDKNLVEDVPDLLNALRTL